MLRSELPSTRRSTTQSTGNRITSAGAILSLALLLCLVGCNDPSNVGRFRATPVTNVILEELGVVDEEPLMFANARDPQPTDLQPREKEYVIGPGDVLDITILELLQTGVQYRDQVQVSETGRVTLPVIGTFQTAGMTELGLTEHIKGLLSPHIIKEPIVNVVVIGAKERVYSISGAAVAAPGRYQLTEVDLRISEALAQAGGVPQSGVDYVYIIRSVSVEELRERQKSQQELGGEEGAEMPRPVPALMAPEPAEEPTIPTPALPEPTKEKAKEKPPEKQTPAQQQQELLESITPMSSVFNSMEALEATGADLGMAGAGLGHFPSDQSAENRPIDYFADSAGSLDSASVQSPEAEKSFKAVREGTRFRIVPQEGPRPETAPTGPPPAAPSLPAEPRLQPQPAAPVESPLEPWGKGMVQQYGEVSAAQEVIRVDMKKLRGNDLSHNILIRPGDDIQVPMNSLGFFFMMGQVGQPGSYALSGERMTLKEAIASSGSLVPMAYPKRCEIIRRVDENREVTHQVDLEKLFAGTAPDIFIKKHDIINVGSHPANRWIAVIRQSFRSTYGFGFVYDRNLADKDMGH